MVAVEAQASGLPVLTSDAVPAAARIMPQLYRTLSVHASFSEWTDALFETLNTGRATLDAAREAVEASHFSIENSARRLVQIYSAGCQG